MDAVRYCFTTNRRWVPISRLDFWFEAGSCKSSISSHQQYYNYKSSPTLLKLKCKWESECPWSFRTSKRKGDELWKIKKYKGPHTCVNTLMNMDHRLDVAYISSLVSPVVRAELFISISTIQNHGHILMRLNDGPLSTPTNFSLFSGHSDPPLMAFRAVVPLSASTTLTCVVSIRGPCW